MLIIKAGIVTRFMISSFEVNVISLISAACFCIKDLIIMYLSYTKLYFIFKKNIPFSKYLKYKLDFLFSLLRNDVLPGGVNTHSCIHDSISNIKFFTKSYDLL